MNFPQDLLTMIMNGANPQQLVIDILQNKMQDNPMGQNLLNMAQNNKSAEIEQFARNYCNSRGVDFDKEFNAFKQKMGFK